MSTLVGLMREIGWAGKGASVVVGGDHPAKMFTVAAQGVSRKTNDPVGALQEMMGKGEDALTKVLELARENDTLILDNGALLGRLEDRTDALEHVRGHRDQLKVDNAALRAKNEALEAKVEELQVIIDMAHFEGGM